MSTLHINWKNQLKAAGPHSKVETHESQQQTRAKDSSRTFVPVEHVLCPHSLSTETRQGTRLQTAWRTTCRHSLSGRCVLVSAEPGTALPPPGPLLSVSNQDETLRLWEDGSQKSRNGTRHDLSRQIGAQKACLSPVKSSRGCGNHDLMQS